jgi:mannose-1-phosphate guanylyltransferase / mannose-6-phosphate isomerase
MIVPVILSGGSGTRLWPLSRELYPKQLLPLVSEKTMLQDTVTRISGIADIAGPLIIANESHRFMIVEQMKQINVSPSAIMLEPVGRNTAPAVAVAALRALTMKKDPVLLVMPADHVIRDTAALQAAVAEGAQYAMKGKLITFGIVPNSPETGYGYIKKGKSVEANMRGRVNVEKPKRTYSHPHIHASTSSIAAFEVASFEEKPSPTKARNFVSSGDYLWNSGMFMFRASVYLKELKRHAPAMLKACEKANNGATKDLDFLRLDEKSFTECPADSIDYAVMEKTGSAVVIPLDAGWSDVGSWSSLWEVLQKDKNGNAASGDVIMRDVKNSFIHAGCRLVAAVGVKDLVIVETADAVLVAHKNNVQKVKQIVEHLKSDNRCEANLHRRVNRPWGAYECINSEDRFQVKRITVNPGASSSLQKHQHRAEHWIVVKGTARITKGKEVLTLSENESTYIPLGTKHRLENPGKIPLELIEVQSGSYLGEDDIERFDDRYGRKGSNK